MSDETERAQALVKEVRESVAKGFANREEADIAARKLAEAQEIAAKASAERDTKERDALNAKAEEMKGLLSAFEASGAPEESSRDLRDGIRTVAEQMRDAGDDRGAADLERHIGKGRGERLVFSGKSVKYLAENGDEQFAKTMRRGVTKNMVEGTGSAGGYLVVPEYMQDEFAEVRYQGNVLRQAGLGRMRTVNTNTVYIPRMSAGGTPALYAENSAITEHDLTLAQISVSLYKIGDISTLSKELVADSTPAALEIAADDTGRHIGDTEETYALTGSGTSQPKGITNVSGTVGTTCGTNTGSAILDAILDTIEGVQVNHFRPSAILMHPRRLNFLRKTKDSSGNYLFNPPGAFRAPRVEFGAVAVAGQVLAPEEELLGVPVYVSTNVPTNLGAGTNQDVIVLGDWSQMLWFIRQEMQVEVSDVAGSNFANDLISVKVTERLGLTYERQPGAFGTVTGAGLV